MANIDGVGGNKNSFHFTTNKENKMTNDKAFKIITSDIENTAHLKSIKIEPITNVNTNTVDSFYVVCSFTVNNMIDYVSTYTRKAIINNKSIVTKL